MPLKFSQLQIPVFVSCPSALNPGQEAAAMIIQRHLTKYKLQWRALGQPDYSRDLPLREVTRMIRHCSGGIVLGFEQNWSPSSIHRRGVNGQEKKIRTPVITPTPWNQLEAGILFSLELPVLVFREPGITGGIFDAGIADVFTHNMPTASLSRTAQRSLDGLFQRWAGQVQDHYYGK